MEAGGRAHRFLSVYAIRRYCRRRFDRNSGLVFGTALHIGVRAFDKNGAVHATLATRDQIFNDDNVQIFLSTFNDGRQAMVFAVNPFGVQADGAVNENGSNQCGGLQLRRADAAATRPVAGLRVGFEGAAHARWV